MRRMRAYIGADAGALSALANLGKALPVWTLAEVKFD
jgi:hypothetical protein